MNTRRTGLGLVAAGLWLQAATGQIVASAGTDAGATRQAAWQHNVQQAEVAIQSLERAAQSGDPEVFRRAAFELKADPVAVEMINQPGADLQTDAERAVLRSEVNRLTMNAREATKTSAKQRIADAYNAEHGYPPGHPRHAAAKDVSFFEATTPPKPGQVDNVKMDWDVTPRVRGQDVGGGRYETIMHEEFFRAAGGEETFGRGTDAARVAGQQRVEVVTEHGTEAYGTSSRAGQDFIRDSSTAPVDVDKTFGHKSWHPLDEAAKQEAQGNYAEAERLKFQAYRESAKQFDKLTKPGVEKLGGEIDPHVREGMDILRQVKPGGISPEEAAQRLKAIGETPESMIAKAASQLDAAGKMTRAGAAAGTGAGPSPGLARTMAGTRIGFLGLMGYGAYSSVQDTLAAPEGAPRAERATRHIGAWIGGTGGALGAGYLATCILTGPVGWGTFLATTAVGLAGAYAGAQAGDQAGAAVFDAVNPDAATQAESDQAAREKYAARDVREELGRFGVPEELAAAADHAFRSGDHERFGALMEAIKRHYAAPGDEDRLAPEAPTGGIDADKYEAAMQRMVEEAREKEALEEALRAAEEGLPAGSGVPAQPRTDPVLGGFLQGHAAAGQAESAAAGRAADAAQAGYEAETRGIEWRAQDRLAGREQALDSALQRERETGASVLAEQEAARRDGFWGRFQDLLLGVGGAFGSGLGGGAGAAAGSAIMQKQVDHLEHDQAKKKQKELEQETVAPPPPPPAEHAEADEDEEDAEEQNHDEDKPRPPKPRPDDHAETPVRPKPPPPAPAGTQQTATPKPQPTPAPAPPAPPQTTPKPPIDMVLMTGGQIREPYEGEVTHRDPDTGYLLPGP